MAQRVAVVIILATTTCLALLALAGHTPWSGRQVVTITGTHGVNTGDVLPVGAWAVIAGCCVILWRNTD